MPPRQTPPPVGKPRRKAGPAMPGSWIWLIILGAVLLMLLVNSFTDRRKLEWSDFVRIVYDTSKHGYANNLSKVVMVGTDRINVELKNTDDVPDDIKEKLKNSKEFWVARPQGEENSRDLEAQLRKIAENNRELKW